MPFTKLTLEEYNKMKPNKKMIASQKRLQKTKGYKLSYQDGLREGKERGRKELQDEFKKFRSLLLDEPLSF